MNQRDDKERLVKKRDPPSEPISTDKTETPSQLWLAPLRLEKRKEKKEKKNRGPKKKKKKVKESFSINRDKSSMKAKTRGGERG